MLELMPNILIAAAASGDAVETAEKTYSAMHAPLLIVAEVGIGVLVLAIVLCLWRMIKGPHLADRVLAGDTMAMIVAGLIVLLTIMYDGAIYYDAALVVAILGFASTVAFSQYIGAKQKYAPQTPSTAEDPA